MHDPPVVIHQAEKLVFKLDRLAAVHGDLGLSLFKVAKFEEAEGGALATYTGTFRHSSALINDEKRAAAALVRLSKTLVKVTGRTALELGVLHDQLALMPVRHRWYRMLSKVACWLLQHVAFSLFAFGLTHCQA